MKHDFTNKHSENESHLDVCLVPAGLRLTITTHTAISGWFNPAQAPAIALAVLEAAGVVPVQRDYESYDDGTPAHLQAVAYFLKQHNEAQERATAEARERADLEAEAFNLYRAYMSVHEPMNAIGDWHMLAERTKEKWLAVARRAREIAKEATK